MAKGLLGGRTGIRYEFQESAGSSREHSPSMVTTAAGSLGLLDNYYRRGFLQDVGMPVPGGRC